MKLLEIIKIPDEDLLGNKDQLKPISFKSKYYAGMYEDARELPGGSGYTWSVDAGPRSILILLYDPKMAENVKDFPDQIPMIGEMILVKEPNDKHFNVTSVAVLPEYRKKKLGLALYGIALDLLKLTLLAGEMQTSSGRRMWQLLKSIPGVQVLALIRKNIKLTPAKLTDKGKKLLEKLEPRVRDSSRLTARFVEEIGGKEFDEDESKYAIPISVSSAGEVHNDFINIYGNFAVQLIARKK